jgi:MarR family transcriptional regulator, organic hydroperoxide resistance regulator
MLQRVNGESAQLVEPAHSTMRRNRSGTSDGWIANKLELRTPIGSSYQWLQFHLGTPMKRAKKPRDRETHTILRHWREAVPDDRLAHLIKDATRALLRALQMRLTEHSVSLGQWTFLRILWETDGITQRELSVLAGVMEPTTFTAVTAMEKLGYVTRKKMHNNKKMVYVFLTPRGRLLKRKLVPLAEEVNRIAVENISPQEISMMRRVLLTMLENLARDEAHSDKRLRIPSTRELARRVQEAQVNLRARSRKRA